MDPSLAAIVRCQYDSEQPGALLGAKEARSRVGHVAHHAIPPVSTVRPIRQTCIPPQGDKSIVVLWSEFTDLHTVRILARSGCHTLHKRGFARYTVRG